MLEAKQVLQERYELIRRLGQNAGRQTWLAKDLTTEERVTVKLLLFGGDVQWDDLKLFEREAKVLKQLHHPKIPQYRDSFQIDEQFLWFGLVQAFIPGYSLKDWLNRGKQFTELEIRQIAQEVLEILRELHQINPPLLHRDIKPSNLIWGEDRQIYLVDFGAVQDRPSLEGSTFTVVGTYGYVPIEQFGGRAVPASDLYSLGATLIHLLTGIPPADLPQKNLRIQFRDRVNISPRLTQWIETLTEPDLENRFSSAQQALQALQSNSAVLPVKYGFGPNTSGQGGVFDSSVVVPDEIKTWNWGAFFLPHYWCLSNQVWIGLIAFIPGIGWFIAVALGANGNEWAWKSRRWKSIEEFKTHQRNWTIAGFVLGIPLIWIPALSMIVSFLAWL